MLLPLTLFLIILVNFVIVNLAPGDPVTVTEISQDGQAMRKEERSMAFGGDDRYLHFREHYGLTLPVLFNTWPFVSEHKVEKLLKELIDQSPSRGDLNGLSLREYSALRTSLGDGAKFIMPQLVAILSDPGQSFEMRQMAMRFFVRGGTRQAIVGPMITPEQREYNQKVASDAAFLEALLILPKDSLEQVEEKSVLSLRWYQENKNALHFEPSKGRKVGMLVFETRFCRYMKRVLTLDFGTLRNDSNKTVISEVTKRFKYSLTLALVPMLLTFFLCQLFAFAMALRQGKWLDHLLNLFFLLLYAAPVFVVAPFLIEMAMHRHFPLTDIPIPLSGFTSPDAVYDSQTSLERLFDVAQHLVLPMIAVMYGSLAAQTRLSRSAVLEVLRQDYVRTAWAKGASLPAILLKHVGKNAGITIVTSLAGSLGVVLGGSLIVETLFEINGFGKFFYEAVLNRDYNVIMFSALAGSTLSLLGYLLADIAYMCLDPRVALD